MNIAISGGGKTCKQLIKDLHKKTFPFMDLYIVGVYDKDKSAEGIVYAKENNIFTTDTIEDFHDIKQLDAIVDLANNKQLISDIVQNRPAGVSVLDYNVGSLLKKYFDTSQKRVESSKAEVVLEKMVSEFLMQLGNAPILILNTDFTIAQANQAFLDTKGKSSEEVTNSYCYKTIHGLDAHCFSAQPEFPCPVLRTLKSEESAFVVQEIPTSDGKSTYYIVVSYPIKNDNGDVVKVIEIWQDLTEEFESRVEKKTRQLKEDLNRIVHEDRLISLGKLSASCVHEINNPIQGLMTFSHLIEDILDRGEPSKADVEDLKRYASLMSKELERCGNIVSGLLSFARETPSRQKSIVVNDLVNSVFSLTRHKMELQDIQPIIRTSDRSLVIHGDTNQLHQCLLNIIFNAMEAMPEGGKLFIITKPDESGEKCRIEIKDTGEGILEENRRQIFDPFFTTKEGDKGTGLGLSIAYGVVKSHGGDIRVKSKPGEGCSFILDFPIQIHGE